MSSYQELEQIRRRLDPDVEERMFMFLDEHPQFSFEDLVYSKESYARYQRWCDEKDDREWDPVPEGRSPLRWCPYCESYVPEMPSGSCPACGSPVTGRFSDDVRAADRPVYRVQVGPENGMRFQDVRLRSDGRPVFVRPYTSGFPLPDCSLMDCETFGSIYNTDASGDDIGEMRTGKNRGIRFTDDPDMVASLNCGSGRKVKRNNRRRAR